MKYYVDISFDEIRIDDIEANSKEEAINYAMEKAFDVVTISEATAYEDE